MFDGSGPNLNYQIRLASRSEIPVITKKLESMNRQTMNFRTMPNSQALVLLDITNTKSIVGGQGFNIDNEFGIPEKFSLHLDEKYRSFLLGLALETVLYKHLLNNNQNYAMLRMDIKSTSSLMDYRKNLGFLAEVGKETMTQEWLDKCKGCELYKEKCNEQAFFKIDISSGYNFGSRRLGLIVKDEFPIDVTLVKEKIRKDDREVYVARWAA